MKYTNQYQNDAWLYTVYGNHRRDDYILVAVWPGVAWTDVAIRLHDLGVRAVVNTCDEYAGPTDVYAELGITQLHLPTVDFVSPTLGDVRAGVEFIDEQLSRGHAVYVHCKAGRGRSATIVLCWLMDKRKIPPTTALQALIEKRKQVSRHLAARPVVQEFWAGIS